MVIEIRLYKRYDMDLVALVDAGYPVSTMIKESLIAYANGNPISYLIDENIAFDLNGKESVRTRIVIPESETNLIYLLKHIKHRTRNNFCKMVLRNALINQNLGAFFAVDNLFQLQKRDIDNNILKYQNAIKLSTIKKERKIKFAGKVVTKKQNKVNLDPIIFDKPTEEKEKNVDNIVNNIAKKDRPNSNIANYMPDTDIRNPETNNNTQYFKDYDTNINVKDNVRVTNEEHTTKTKQESKDVVDMDDFLNAFDML
ncbi:hypothetical protein [Lachnospira multipara]|uniref:Uncharacterized protein n=1 Tax=Lachnospira multipara TaxID=28051 RepID=A0A1H5VV00_9FIRM|nr:hypothetical protein [Lachnospira multipara]SEF90826.1 hypothetical protein SAMN05216537_112102 [Lachnospira multipara]